MKTWQFHLSDLGWILCGHMFLFFRLDYMSEHSYSHSGFILFIAQNLPCCLHFAFCLSIRFIKLKCVPHPYHH